MLLPQTAEYALRAVASLAQGQDGQFLTRDEIVEHAGIPAAYAAKVLRRLAVAGIVEAQRGWHGGFRLAVPPDQLLVLEVLAAVDCEPDVEHCAFGYAHCDPDAPCPLHPLWADLQERILAWARDTRISHVIVGGAVRPRS